MASFLDKLTCDTNFFLASIFFIILAEVKKKKNKKKNKKVNGLPPEIAAVPELAKYWAQRYRLFSRFDDGIKLDRGKVYMYFLALFWNHFKFTESCKNNTGNVHIPFPRFSYFQHFAPFTFSFCLHLYVCVSFSDQYLTHIMPIFLNTLAYIS